MPKVSSNALVRKAYLGGQGGRKLLNRVKPRCARMALNWMGKLSGGNNQHSHLHFHLPIYGSSWALSLPFHHITSGWHHQGCLIGSKYIYILCSRKPKFLPLRAGELSHPHTENLPPPHCVLIFPIARTPFKQTGVKSMFHQVRWRSEGNSEGGSLRTVVIDTSPLVQILILGHAVPPFPLWPVSAQSFFLKQICASSETGRIWLFTVLVLPLSLAKP